MLRILVSIIVSYSFLFSLELQRPKVYKEHIEIKNWFMSEKLDGIRAYWNTKELLTRKGKKIHVPKEFLKNFPNFELDGELWTKRNDFENIQSIVMDKTPSKDWKEITYNIFEVPKQKGNFSQRLEIAKKWFERHHNKQVTIIPQIKVKDKEHLNRLLQEIISKKGEGLIVKNPNKSYHTGRSSHILKVKEAQDMEGEVIGINISEKTKVLKSLKVKLENGIVFNLGTGFTKKQRINPPKIGEIVTFKYYGFTKYKKPKFASFLRVRKD
ncbi:DNA ligase [Halarcobacter mediterraneus]|uniref:DNA ligase n=1 Tax=Halarcobacter mediterraneus TaxID=2023153 RepID=UPI001E41F1CD|nr:DNA ligase [Halarcobacter mediterraneus]